MSNRHFNDTFIDDLGGVDPESNYFIPVWDAVFKAGIKPRHILDIGCGNGAFTVYAGQRTGAKLFGVDGSEYALSQAAGRGYEHLKHIDDFSSERIDWDDGSFDFCLSKDLLEHLIRPDMVMQEAYRMICKGGHFLVHVPNHFPLYGRLKFLLTNDIDTFGYFPGTPRWEFPHIRFFTRQSLIDLAQRAGFEIKMDLSHHFPAIPGMAKVPFGLKVGRQLAYRFPSQFSEAFTLLLRKL
jgi:SAM-dependent methyltransferase